MSDAARPVRPEHRVPAHLGHRPLQLPLRLLHAAEGLQWLPKAEILTYEEIAEVVRQLAPLGLRRLRITGGEPTIRPRSRDAGSACCARFRGSRTSRCRPTACGFPQLAHDAARRRARSRQHERRPPAAGPHRGDRAAQPRLRSGRCGAAAAGCAGLAPIKINVVVMRGINDDEVVDFARLTLDHPWHVRFIELMPVGDMRELTWEHVVPSDEVLARIARARRARARRRPAARQRPGAVLSARRRAQARSA